MTENTFATLLRHYREKEISKLTVEEAALINYSKNLSRLTNPKEKMRPREELYSGFDCCFITISIPNRSAAKALPLKEDGDYLENPINIINGRDDSICGIKEPQFHRVTKYIDGTQVDYEDGI